VGVGRWSCEAPLTPKLSLHPLYDLLGLYARSGGVLECGEGVGHGQSVWVRG